MTKKQEAKLPTMIGMADREQHQELRRLLKDCRPQTYGALRRGHNLSPVFLETQGQRYPEIFELGTELSTGKPTIRLKDGLLESREDILMRRVLIKAVRQAGANGVRLVRLYGSTRITSRDVQRLLEGVPEVAMIRKGSTALISSINRSADAPIEMHCGCAGIHRETYLEWRKLASEEPEGEHARQMRKVDKALYAAWRRLHEVAVKHKASEVLFRRHHEHYPSERQRLELTGAEGLPLIPTENAFAVVIELASPQPDDQREFMIEHQGGLNDGKREIWQPNGQEPSP